MTNRMIRDTTMQARKKSLVTKPAMKAGKNPFSNIGGVISKILTAPGRFIRKGLEKDRAYTQFKDETYRKQYGEGQPD